MTTLIDAHCCELDDSLTQTRDELAAERAVNEQQKREFEELAALAEQRLSESIASQRAFEKLQVRAR